MLDLSTLTGKDIKELVKLIVVLEKDATIGSFLDSLAEMGTQHISPSNFSQRQDFPKQWKETLAQFIEHMEDRSRMTLKEYIRQSTGSSAPSRIGDLTGWLDLSRLFPPRGVIDVLRHNSFEDQLYLLIRATGGDKCRTAPMKVSFDPKADVWPKFETERPKGEGKSETLRGSIFTLEEYVYSIGKVHGRGGLRIAKFSTFTREYGPDGVPIVVDLYGLRLGHTRTLRRPFAHAVYAFCVTKNKEDEFEAAQKVQTFEELEKCGLFQGQELDDIRNVLATKIEDGGLLINDMLPGF